MSNPSSFVTEQSITVTIKGETYSVQAGDANFEKVKAAVEAKQWDDVVPLLNPGLAIERYSQGEFVFKKNMVTHKGEKIPTELEKRLIQMAHEKADIRYLLRFWERLKKNPSKASVDQLYIFIEKHELPIDPQGFVLAYKGVGRDYKDYHSRRYENKPGAVIKMDRSEVDPNPKSHCSRGLHIGALRYAQSFTKGGHLMVVRLDPKDVVSVPEDSNGEKMRVCEYHVVGHYGTELPTLVVTEEDLPSPETVVPVVAQEEPGSFETLMAQPLAELRQYATHTLRIPRASKIPGGKKALVKKILAAQKKGYGPKPTEAHPAKIVRPGKASKAKGSKEKLMVKSLDELRKYAAHKLKLVGASKIPGGKEALVDRILDILSKDKK